MLEHFSIRHVMSWNQENTFISIWKQKLLKVSRNTLSVSFVRELELDFHTVGCRVDKGSIQFWPIQCRISNIPRIKPIVVGIYKGHHKPRDPNIFFEKFIADVKAIMSNGGINFHASKLPIRLRCFIADAPARAFVLNHSGHMSQSPCSKCMVFGTLNGNHYSFDGIDHSPRTDEEYPKRLHENHHKEGPSPLASLPIGIVTQVPFEYMHLVCLGVMKKLLSAWVSGSFTFLSKLPALNISVISTRLNSLGRYCPLDFARRPRAIEEYCKYKATEFRQFLLYTGPVVLYGVLNDDIYKHFLILHAAIKDFGSRISIEPRLEIHRVSFAEICSS